VRIRASLDVCPARAPARISFEGGSHEPEIDLPLLAPWRFATLRSAGARPILGRRHVGFGTAWAKANSQALEGDPNSANFLGSCTVGTADPTCLATKGLGGFFMGIGGDVMLKEKYGIGGEISFNPAKRSYGALDYRQTFYDFNGIYAPINTKRASLHIEGGIGAARTGFSLTQSGCAGTAVCTTSTQSVGSSSHFQVHLGVGVQIFLTDHIYVKPQFDYHYVPGLTNQFGTTSVPSAMVYIGYNSGYHSK